MERYPEIELDLDFTDRLVDVIDEGFDVMIRGSALRDSRLVSRPLGPYRACLVAAPAYLERKGTPTKPDDLLNHACLHYRWSTTGKLYQWPLLHSTFTASGLSLPTTMVCSSLDVLLYMALAGRGVTCVPDFSVRKAVADGRLKTLLDTYVADSNTFHVVWPSNRQLTPKVRVFVDFVTAHFSQHLVMKSDKRKRR
jgi:DNA-binding transcriptional LysR family regulator